MFAFHSHGRNDCTSVFYLFVKALHESVPALLMGAWYTVKAVAVAKTNQVQLQSVFWLLCEEVGVVRYNFHLQ